MEPLATEGVGDRGSLRISLTTYTIALSRSSRQLLEQLLGERAELVEVDTADRMTMRILAVCGEQPVVADAAEARTAVREAIASGPAFEERSLGLAGSASSTGSKGRGLG